MGVGRGGAADEFPHERGAIDAILQLGPLQIKALYERHAIGYEEINRLLSVRNSDSCRSMVTMRVLVKSTAVAPDRWRSRQ